MKQNSNSIGLSKYIPILGWLPGYRGEWLRFDVLAGITAAAVIIPKVLAYATIVGLSVELIVASTTLALLVGAFLLLAGIFRMGFIANFISSPVPRTLAVLAWPRVVRYAKLGMPFLLASALLICLIVPAWCATTTTMARPNAGAGPTPVNVSLYVVDVFEVSGSDQAFNADVVLIAEWRDPSMAGKGTVIQSAKMEDIWEPRLQLVNQRGASALLPQRVEIHPDGLVRYRQRWSGRFTARMDLRDFPLDRQRFHVQVVSLGYSRAEVELIPDLGGKRSGRAEQFSITDWKLGPARMEMADYEPAPGVKALAGAQLIWEGKRQVGYYTAQVILPLVMIVLMGWTALWISPSVVPARMSAAITTMLTLIAYRFALGRLVPNLPYLTRFDYFTLGSTILIFLVLLLVAATAFLIAQNKMAVAERINRWARLGFPVIFGAVFLLIWWM